MTDSSVFLLLHEIIKNPVLRIQIRINIHLTDIVEQIKVKILYLAFLQLLLKNLFYLRHVGKIIARNLLARQNFSLGYLCSTRPITSSELPE